MILVTDSLTDGIRLDIAQAWLDLQAAEQAQQHRDDGQTRERLAACRSRIDAILDMWLAAGGPDR